MRFLRIYTESGESCLETPEGKQLGRKGANVVVLEGVPMELVASGTETRRGIIRVLHSSAGLATAVGSAGSQKGFVLA